MSAGSMERGSQVGSHYLPVDGKEKWSILYSIKIESIVPAREAKCAEEGTLIGIKSL
jgi:hypothetical protein